LRPAPERQHAQQIRQLEQADLEIDLRLLRNEPSRRRAT
jgi:hypothetical protein